MQWDKEPSFQPKESFKELIDMLFDDTKPKEQERVKPPSKQLSIPETPPLLGEKEKEALKYARKELEEIRKAFLRFSETVNDTVLYAYLYPHVEEFVTICKQLQTMIEDDIDKDALTEKGLPHYEKMRSLRSRILSSVLEKYQQGHS